MGSPIKGRVNEEKGRPQDLQLRSMKESLSNAELGPGVVLLVAELCRGYRWGMRN